MKKLSVLFIFALVLFSACSSQTKQNEIKQEVAKTQESDVILIDEAEPSKKQEVEVKYEVEVKKEIEIKQENIITKKTLTNSALFELNKDIVKETADGEPFKSILEEIRNYPNALIVVEGHTDKTGSKAFNQQLSERRATNFAKRLNELNNGKNKIQTVGYGFDRPIASNDTREGRIKNRRVEVILVNEEIVETITETTIK